MNEQEKAQGVLQTIGMQVIERGGRQYLEIADDHPKLEEMYRETPWAGRWAEFFARLPGAIKLGGATLIPLEACLKIGERMRK